MVRKVISGGQVGADIAALRVAKRLGIETGGFMPRHWQTLEGPHPEYEYEYGMTECFAGDGSYKYRTKMNVLESRGTMRFATDWNSRGEQATLRELKKFKKPYHDVDILVAQVDIEREINRAMLWLQRKQVTVLNVAGNANKSIEPFVEQFLEGILL